MKTPQDFKKLLKINTLVSFEELKPNDQAWLDSKDLRDSYLEASKVFPDKIAVVHTREVANYLNKTHYGGYSEDLDLRSHFPRVLGRYCHTMVQDDYVLVDIEVFRKYVEQCPNGRK